MNVCSENIKEGKTTVYISSDGKIHQSYRDFVRHKSGQFIESEIKALMRTEEGALPSEDEAGNLALFEDDVPKWINLNAEVIRSILNSALTIKRAGRKKLS